MPTPRLPWFRFWSSATQHAKARKLSDAEFRTWVELLDLASQQKWRGRFSNRKDAQSQSRRPMSHIKQLVEAELVDEDAGDAHLTMHDWDWWQRWRREEVEDGDEPEEGPDGPRDQHLMDHAINTGSTPDEPREGPPDEHAEGHAINAPPLRAENKRIKDHLEGEKTRRKRGLAADAAPSRGNPKVAALVDAFRRQGIEPTWREQDYRMVKASMAAPEWIAGVYAAVFRGRYGDDFMRKRLNISESIGWVDGFRSWLVGQNPGNDHTGCREGCKDAHPEKALVALGYLA